MTVGDQPKRPTGLRGRGLRFWTGTLDSFSLERSELELLAEACRQLDMCDDLRRVIDRDGLTIQAANGSPRMHPAVAELRQARALTGRLLGQLGLPDEDDQPLIRTGLSARGAQAARNRWGGREAKAQRDGTP